ncbi:MAG: elongation factor Ts [Clostridia bacterium]|nr:elongation factor Ts [Clostridia bacterium]
MANITAKDVAALRAQTGIGMMECKKALVEADGNVEAAIKILRERGQLKAEGKAGRIAADGIVDILKEGDVTAMIEVNSETDFVAKNAKFQDFVKELLKTVIANRPANVDELLASRYDDAMTVEEKLKEQIFVIGEKLSIRRFVVVEGTVSTYIHGMGSIGVIAKFDADETAKASPRFAEYTKNIALQIAAVESVPYLSREDVPASVLAEEKAILEAQIANDPSNAKKPPQIIEKMVQGRLGKYYDTHCLLDMAYVKEDNMKVSQYIASEEKEMGGKAPVIAFWRFEKGEGIEKREENFADEIAKMTGNQ